MAYSGNTNYPKLSLTTAVIASVATHAVLVIVFFLSPAPTPAPIDSQIYELELFTSAAEVISGHRPNVVAQKSAVLNSNILENSAPNFSEKKSAATENTNLIENSIAQGVGTSETVYAVGELSQPPKLMKEVKAIYPQQARLSLEEGHVLFELIVKANGKPENIRKKESSNAIFEAAAQQAVEKLIFKPGKKDGQDVAVRIQYRVRFQLR